MRIELGAGAKHKALPSYFCITLFFGIIRDIVIKSGTPGQGRKIGIIPEKSERVASLTGRHNPYL